MSALHRGECRMRSSRRSADFRLEVENLDRVATPIEPIAGFWRGRNKRSPVGFCVLRRVAGVGGRQRKRNAASPSARAVLSRPASLVEGLGIRCPVTDARAARRAHRTDGRATRPPAPPRRHHAHSARRNHAPERGDTTATPDRDANGPGTRRTGGTRARQAARPTRSAPEAHDRTGNPRAEPTTTKAGRPRATQARQAEAATRLAKASSTAIEKCGARGDGGPPIRPWAGPRLRRCGPAAWSASDAITPPWKWPRNCRRSSRRRQHHFRISRARP